jgi:hypothetical protein
VCSRRGLHRLTVPFTRGICLGCWLDWHFGPKLLSPPMSGPLLPFTPPPPPRTMGPWRPRIRPELRTIRERVVIYYTLADVPVAAVLAVTGWPVEGAW